MVLNLFNFVKLVLIKLIQFNELLCCAAIYMESIRSEELPNQARHPLLFPVPQCYQSLGWLRLFILELLNQL